MRFEGRFDFQTKSHVRLHTAKSHNISRVQLESKSIEEYILNIKSLLIN